MFTLYLIRHGRTEANEKKLYCGFSDISLSKKGAKDIKKNAEAYPVCDAYFTSGMVRCNETLKIIYGKDVVFEELPGLREINVGIFELKSYEELKDAQSYINWISDKTGEIKCPGGESKNEFSSRVGFAFLSLTNIMVTKGLSSGLCVIHGGVIVSIMERLFVSRNNFYDWQPDSGCGYKLIYTEDGFIGYEAFNLKGIFKK